MKLKDIAIFLKDNKLPAFRIKQIRQAVYKEHVLSFADIKNIPKDLRQKLEAEIELLSLSPVDEFTSKDNKSAKVVFLTNDNNKISSVLISPKPDVWTACLSSQIGCPLKCGFCATGYSGYQRNLSKEEICDQVLYWQSYLKNLGAKLTNIVYMGMGEPFLNWDNVKKSIEDLIDEDLFGMASRSISVSSVGIPDKIKIFSRTFPQVNLALSLHSANNAVRDKIVPVNRKHNVEQLHKVIDNYITDTNRKVFIEYLMLRGVNDTQDDAEELVAFIKKLKKPFLAHVNLIPYNETESKFKASRIKTIKAFRDTLVHHRTNATIRKSLGGNIEAACGQLKTSK